MSGRATERASLLVISVLSARPDAVSGGNARIRVEAPAKIKPTTLRLLVGDIDHTAQLTPTDRGLEGVVDGLVDGPNQLRAVGPSGLAAELTVVSHPIAGPLFSGPRTRPFICQTEAFRAAIKLPLGPPLDADCSIAPRVGYVYRSSETDAFLALPVGAATDPELRPRDLASVTRPNGEVRPFIVRVEIASIDRGIAQMAMLDDPTDPVDQNTRGPGGVGTDDSAWNGKLIYAFGGSCGGGARQGTRTVGVLSPDLLGQGYALVSNSLNAFEQNCSDVVAAEAFSMTREHFIEGHGAPTYTMGIGCSGGAAQAYGIADNYPGLLDGIVAGCSVADVGTDAAQILFDARLLQEFARRHPNTLSTAQLQAVSGLESPTKLRQLSDLARVLDPVAGLDPSIPRTARYDPRTNPGGVRGTIWDQSSSIYGTQTTAGVTRTRRPVGNAGVQYGLTALQQGRISVETFLALNAGIGGLDADLHPTPARTVPDPQATARAYATGRVLNGGGGLGDIPIIDYRSYRYPPQTAGLDLGVQSLILRDRLVRANGDADNLVRLGDADHGRFDLEQGAVPVAIRQLDRWITAVQAIGLPGHRAVVAARPPDLAERCWAPDGAVIVRPATGTGRDRCDVLYPAYATPRIAAGGPLASNVLSCALTRPAMASYGRSFTAAQRKRLLAIFPTGVCDWNQLGLGAQRPTKGWQTG